MLVNAMGSEAAGRILDTFKQEEKKMIFQNIPVDQEKLDNVFEKEYKMHGLKGLVDKMSALENTYQSEKDALTERKLTLKEAIRLFDEKIAESKLQIQSIESSILQKETRIQDYHRQTIDLKKSIHKSKSTILKYLSHIYSTQYTIYSDNEDIDSIKMLILNDGNIDEILSDILYKWLIAEVWQKYIEEYRSLVRELHTLTSTMQEEIRSLDTLRIKLSKQKEVLEAQRIEKDAILKITEWREELYEKYLSSQQEEKRKLQMQWIYAMRAYQDSVKELKEEYNCKDGLVSASDLCERMSLYLQREREIRSQVLTGANFLDWPVGSRTISTLFHDPGYYEQFGSHHDAIDISEDQGVDIRAAADGYVTYILPPSPGGYSYLAIRHPSGITTVYGHLSDVRVELFQYVRKWEVIANVWGDPGTPGAGPMTTGSHLHFEVFEWEEPVDPLRYITIKDLHPDELPTRYSQKFVDDVIASTNEEPDNYSQKFVIQWTTEIDRQKYLLTTYAVPSFRDWSLWTDESLAAGIDPSFFMCVWLAETSLGYHLKTAYNIGNIGNTDSGSTYTFSSPREGIYWMARTFNNKFLGKYTKISQLSRWGNTTGPIYASSNENWHNNIIRCLSSLKWEFIEDDYVFRIKKAEVPVSKK